MLQNAPRNLCDVLLSRRQPDRLALGEVGRRLARGGRGRGLRKRIAELNVEDGNDRVVLLGEVVQQDRLGEALLLVGAVGGGLDDTEEVRLLVLEMDELEVAFDLTGLQTRERKRQFVNSGEPPRGKAHNLGSVVPNVAQQLRVLARVHYELPDVVVAKRDLLLSRRAGEIGVEADEIEVVKGLFSVGLGERAGVAVEKASKVEVHDFVA